MLQTRKLIFYIHLRLQPGSKGPENGAWHTA